LYPPQESQTASGPLAKTYFPRGYGPEPLSGNADYGAFSKAVFGNKFRLLRNPNEVLHDSRLSAAVALWRWFQPRHNQISLHDIAIRNWTPTTSDIANGFQKNNIFSNMFAFMDPDTACSKTPDISSGFWDGVIKQIGQFTGMDPTPAGTLTCEGYSPASTVTAADVLPIYWQLNTDPNSAKSCAPGTTKSDFLIYIPGDYKRCVVESFSAATTAEEKAAEYTYSGPYCYPFHVKGYQYLIDESLCIPKDPATPVDNYFPGVWMCLKPILCSVFNPFNPTDPTYPFAYVEN